jgi:hypothetical protein
VTAAQWEVARFLEALGYAPARQKVQDEMYAWKDKKSGRVIAKMGMRKNAPYVAFKFFGVPDPPARYRDALLREIEARAGQYAGPVRHPARKAYCGYCPSCTGGGLGYFCVLPNGSEVLRCGAYPISIPDFAEADVREAIEVLRAQHAYFLTL